MTKKSVSRVLISHWGESLTKIKIYFYHNFGGQISKKSIFSTFLAHTPVKNVFFVKTLQKRRKAEKNNPSKFLAHLTSF